MSALSLRKLPKSRPIWEHNIEMDLRECMWTVLNWLRFGLICRDTEHHDSRIKKTDFMFVCLTAAAQRNQICWCTSASNSESKRFVSR